MEEEYSTSSKFHHYINIFESRIPSVPPTIQCRYDWILYDLDIEMENVSIRLDQDLMMEILFRNVRFRRIRSGYTIYIDKQHHGIRADILARKWGIGLDKTKRTVQYTS